MEVVYVLQNPEFPALVKIGRTAKTIEARMRELDTTGIPVPFECLAAWEVEDGAKVEGALHAAFHDHRVRHRREFFRLDAQRVIAILEVVGVNDITPTDDVVSEDSAEDDREALENSRKRREWFRFPRIGVPLGSVLTSIWDSAITCEVVDERRVRFRGERMSVHRAARIVAQELGKRTNKRVQGVSSWEFKGKTIDAIHAEWIAAEDE